jgi:hypothetical protein
MGLRCEVEGLGVLWRPGFEVERKRGNGATVASLIGEKREGGFGGSGHCVGRWAARSWRAWAARGRRETWERAESDGWGLGYSAMGFNPIQNKSKDFKFNSNPFKIDLIQT